MLIPAKSLPEAKSRLSGSTTDAAAHERLVLAIRADTVAAARAADGVDRIVVVLDRDGHPAQQRDLVFVQTQPGLNPALTEADAYAAARWPQDGVAALVGDLPALRAEELADALRQAAGFARAFVADTSGAGTTLLTALPGHRLAPAFGTGSAARHAAGATLLTGRSGLRQDVDTETDLAEALRLGVGPHTRAIAAPATRRVHIGQE